MRSSRSLIGVFLLLASSQLACSDGETIGTNKGKLGASLVALPSSAVVAAEANRAVAYGPDGRQLWSFSLPNGDILAAAPVAAGNSFTYLRGEKGVYAIAPDGKLVWSANHNDGNATIKGIVALGDSTVAVSNTDTQLINYDSSGKVRWTFSLPNGDRLSALPVNAPNSEVYLRGATKLYAVDSNGFLTWEVEL